MAELGVETEAPEAVALRAALPRALLKVAKHAGDTYLCLDRAHLREAATLLRDDPEFQYRYFVECLGVDYSRWEHPRDMEGRFEVVYNLFTLKHNRRIFLKVSVDDGQTVPSLVSVFLGAEYPERETADMFGIVFEGNEMRPGERFLLPDDWIGFPLRKEYPLGGEDVLFDRAFRGPAVEDVSMPHAGESFQGKTGSEDVSGR